MLSGQHDSNVELRAEPFVQNFTHCTFKEHTRSKTKHFLVCSFKNPLFCTFTIYPANLVLRNKTLSSLRLP